MFFFLRAQKLFIVKRTGGSLDLDCLARIILQLFLDHGSYTGRKTVKVDETFRVMVVVTGFSEGGQVFQVEGVGGFSSGYCSASLIENESDGTGCELSCLFINSSRA